jgi:hypothetical protein
MDDADQVTEQESITKQANLYKSHRNIPTATATGFFLFCDVPVENDRLWCGPECRDDWQLVNDS